MPSVTYLPGSLFIQALESIYSVDIRWLIGVQTGHRRSQFHLWTESFHFIHTGFFTDVAFPYIHQSLITLKTDLNLDLHGYNTRSRRPRTQPEQC